MKWNSNTFKDDRVVVIGGDHHNTLGVIRCLGHMGVKSIVICITDNDNAFIIHSKYVYSYVLINSDSKIVYTLEKIKSKSNKIVVIACSDGASCILDQFSDRLQDFYLPGINEPMGGGYFITRIKRLCQN